MRKIERNMLTKSKKQKEKYFVDSTLDYLKTHRPDIYEDKYIRESFLKDMKKLLDKDYK